MAFGPLATLVDDMTDALAVLPLVAAAGGAIIGLSLDRRTGDRTGRPVPVAN